MSYNLERKCYFNICLEQEIKNSCSKGRIFENRGSTYIIYVQIYDIHSYINKNEQSIYIATTHDARYLTLCHLAPAGCKQDGRSRHSSYQHSNRSIALSPKLASSSSQWPPAVCGAIRGGGGGSIYSSLFYSNISRTHAAVRYQSEATIYQMTPFHCKLKFTGDDDRFVAVPETSVQLNLARRKNAYSFCWCRSRANTLKR